VAPPSRSCSHGEHRHNVPKMFKKRTAVQRAKDRLASRDAWRDRVRKLADQVSPHEVTEGLAEGPCERGFVSPATPEAKGLRKVADQLDACGRRVDGMYGCPDHGAWFQTHTCSHALCPWCSSSRRGRLLSKYEGHVERYRTRDGSPRAVMLTLTQPTTDGESFRSGVARLRKRHGKLVRRMRREVPGIGGLTSYEATPRPGRAWHVHAHILLHLPQALPAGWTHSQASEGWSPVNPWKVRWLWASSELDLRFPENKARAETLEGAALAASEDWEEKMQARRDSPTWSEAARSEVDRLASWAELCQAFEVPAVIDVRSKHPSEAVKYITKGPAKVALDGDDPLTDWHVLDLIRSIRGMRRTDAWGSLYRLAIEEEEEEEREPGCDDDLGTVPCPGCGRGCDPVFAEELRPGERPLPDWLVRARVSDARTLRPLEPG
jgi:hypothetical protein